MRWQITVALLIIPLLLCNIAGSRSGITSDKLEQAHRPTGSVSEKIEALAYPNATTYCEVCPLRPAVLKYTHTEDGFDKVCNWYRSRMTGSKLRREGYTFVGESGNLIAESPSDLKQVTIVKIADCCNITVVITETNSGSVISLSIYCNDFSP